MATDPDNSLSPNPSSEPLPAAVAQALAGGLGDFSLRELLGLLRSNLGHAERQQYLARTPGDKGNGAYARSLKVGSIPIEMAVPRTRNGAFRPIYAVHQRFVFQQTVHFPYPRFPQVLDFLPQCHGP